MYVLIRVFQPWSKGVVSLYCLLAVVVGYYTIITFIKIFICNPVSAYWNMSERAHATCLRQSGIIIADSVISFLTDIAIFAFPVALTWSLQMPFWKKVKVVFLLGLGGIAVAFSLFRLVIGIHERAFPHDTRIFMRSILTAYVPGSILSFSYLILISYSQKCGNRARDHLWLPSCSQCAHNIHPATLVFFQETFQPPQKATELVGPHF